MKNGNSVLKILQFAFLCNQICSASIFEIFSNSKFTTSKASIPTAREVTISDEDIKQTGNDCNKTELTIDVSAFTEIKPMEAFIARTSTGRESVLNSLYELNVELKEKETEINNKKEENFLFGKEGNKILSLIQNFPILPLIKNEFSIANVMADNNGSLAHYIDSLREDAWSHFKAIILQYVNTYDSADLNIKDSLLTNLLLKSLDLGDNINIIHLLGRKVNPEVYDFIKKKLQPINDAIQTTTGVNNNLFGINSTFLPSINELVNDVAWLAIQHIIQNLIKRIDSREELMSYADDLYKTNPFAAKGLLFALNLPSQRPKQNEVEAGRSLSYDSPSSRFYITDSFPDSSQNSYYRSKSDRQRDDIGLNRDSYDHHDDGYDHHDGYGYKEVDYGYGYEMSKGYYLDPYLILAGIGAAALLAYLAFRILTTTTMAPGKRKKRDLHQIDIDMTSAIYNHIEMGKLLFENDLKAEVTNFVGGVNELWSRKSSSSCMKCWLVKNLKIYNLSSLRILLLSVVSNVFGAGKIGQSMDNTTQKILDGKSLTCNDDIHYCNTKSNSDF